MKTYVSLMYMLHETGELTAESGVVGVTSTLPAATALCNRMAKRFALAADPPTFVIEVWVEGEEKASRTYRSTPTGLWLHTP